MRLMHWISLALLPILAMSGRAHASDADFKLKNRTGYKIDAVYVSPHSSHVWGHDVIGHAALDDGGEVSIRVPHGGTACHFDIQVKYHDDNSTAEWGDVDLCKHETIALSWDAKAESTRAVGE